MNRQLVQLKDQFDSLSVEVERKDQFILNFQRVMAIPVSLKILRRLWMPNPGKTWNPLENKTEQPDTTFKEFEKSDLSLVSLTS